VSDDPQGLLPVPAQPTTTEVAQVEQVSSPFAQPPSWSRSLEPAAELAGRALIEALAVPPEPSDPGLLDQLAIQSVRAAEAVATDRNVPGRDRAAAVTDARRIVEVVAGAHEHAEARRGRWLSSVARAVGLLALGLLLVRAGAVR
jgi:hypothetical protein